MALEADCGASTVLEPLNVASTGGFSVPGEYLRIYPSRPSLRGPPRHRHTDFGFPAGDSSWGTSNSKFEIRNSKFPPPYVPFWRQTADSTFY